MQPHQFPSYLTYMVWTLEADSFFVTLKRPVKPEFHILYCITSTCEHEIEIVIKILSFNTSGFTYTDDCQYSYPWEVIQLPKWQVLGIPDHSVNNRIFMTLAECYSGSSCEKLHGEIFINMPNVDKVQHVWKRLKITNPVTHPVMWFSFLGHYREYFGLPPRFSGR